MLSAIEFHGKLLFIAGKIEKILQNRVLTAKFIPRNLTIP